MTLDERVRRIRRAAVRFASDHGPLSQAIGGDEKAQHAVGFRLFEELSKEGLAIVVGSNPAPPEGSE